MTQEPSIHEVLPSAKNAKNDEFELLKKGEK